MAIGPTDLNGTTPGHQSSLQADIVLLQSLLAQDGSEGDVELNFAELLERLERAEGIVSGVEGRLDEIIGNLDGLLGRFGDGDAPDSQETDDESRKDAQEGQDIFAEKQSASQSTDPSVEGAAAAES
ncbi:hypothetical protein WOLCODRAFT_160657 [Wolfiporia cocos MD-104 SS10]|uniref:Uncharacterized protein n=1 Tax=Wolfiporia cocos (strain MD-104) TaxID=742152 RepID=A0A2H3JDX3_WOLCO|nr:hypothetical protein WOLCODRAFT_160657 [Wolfiporia cocos MD-104 SS10]